MAQGHFVTTGDAPLPPSNDREGGSAMGTNEGLIPPGHDDGGGGRNQVLLGCADGSVLLLLGADWTPRHLFTCDYSITRLVPFRVPVETRPAAVTNAASTASSAPITELGSASVATPTVTMTAGPVLDWVVCAGHSNRVFVYEGSHCRATLELTDWPLDLTVDDIDLDGRPEIIVLDGESIVKAFRLS
ncbi:hypothetical protein IWQ60_011859 [Tieghemiomyces parasiticus]|uniref:Uncharacterized protein n=1 Tax=Tieghemiomyces parasiticus TaxID=78921 RepID=A0A9W7ZN78_9FUNG|nr:hypothetical protein IWQ60_011859 [Tieghemiomyces parasiticus]